MSLSLSVCLCPLHVIVDSQEFMYSVRLNQLQMLSSLRPDCPISAQWQPPAVAKSGDPRACLLYVHQ